MTFPSRMNLIDIVISQRDDTASGTIYDGDFGEPIANEVDLTSVTLQGQIRNQSDDQLTSRRTGDAGNSSGNLMFKQQYLTDQGVTLKKGDRITSVGGITFDAEIIEIRNTAPLRGGFLFAQVFYRERSDTHSST